MMAEEICRIGAEQVPYFRTAEFSDIMLENERLMLALTHAAPGSRTVFLTGSGTAAMEAAVMNAFTSRDRVLVIDGGSFGHRFAQICEIHDIPCTRIVPEFGHGISAEELAPYDGKGYTGFLVNADETSVGVLYDLQVISDFCRRNGIFLIVDAVSSFLCDPFDMQALGAGIMLTGSQKALACPPGVSILVLSEEAVDRVERIKVKSLYFDLQDALKNGERGQTPFTPAVGILRQIHSRLKAIEAAGGAESEILYRKRIAGDFRSKIGGLPLEITSCSLSNAVTPLHPKTVSAHKVFTVLKDEYEIWICPNGGELKDRIFRVGHLGDLTEKDNDTLIGALNDLCRRGIM